MRTLQSILFATDLRQGSEQTVRTVEFFARAFGSRIHVLHVMEPVSHVDLGQLYRQKLGDLLLQDLLRQFNREQTPEVEASLKTGPVADTILKTASEVEANLIVTEGGHVSPKQGTYCVGPIAEAVMEHALMPVLAVRPRMTEPAFQTILCPVDHSSVSLRGLTNAIQLARTFQSRLVILSVAPELSWLSAAAETGQFADAKAEYELKWFEELETFLAGVDLDNLNVTKDGRVGVPHEQIIAAVEQHQADLLVMGATGRTGLVRVLLGSTTRRVLRELPCSMLVVKQETE